MPDKSKTGSNVVDIESRKPHLVVHSPDGNEIHVLPVCVLRKLESGEMDITEVEGYRFLVRAMSYEMLRYFDGDP